MMYAIEMSSGGMICVPSSRHLNIVMIITSVWV
jgi:hypothetical protein